MEHFTGEEGSTGGPPASTSAEGVGSAPPDRGFGTNDLNEDREISSFLATFKTREEESQSKDTREIQPPFKKRKPMREIREMPEALFRALDAPPIRPKSSGFEGPPFRCDICHLVFNSAAQEQEHLKGKKHQFKLSRRQGDRQESLHQSGYPHSTYPSTNGEDGPGKIFVNPAKIWPPIGKSESLICRVCRKTFSSAKQTQEHLAGKKHQERLQLLNQKRFASKPPRDRDYPRPVSPVYSHQQHFNFQHSTSYSPPPALQTPPNYSHFNSPPPYSPSPLHSSSHYQVAPPRTPPREDKPPSRAEYLKRKREEQSNFYGYPSEYDYGYSRSSSAPFQNSTLHCNFI